jgi:hypothetical protein
VTGSFNEDPGTYSSVSITKSEVALAASKKIIQGDRNWPANRQGFSALR